MANQGHSRARVLDGNHGIERVVRNNTSYGVAYTSGAPEVVYLPWFRASRGCYVPSSRYYTRVGGWERVECATWEAAYNHIARSRGLPTSRQVGSSYVQDARNAGVLPETQAQLPRPADVPTTSITYGLLVSNVGWVRQGTPSYDEVKQLFDSYAASGEYTQVTMWSSAEHEPIHEAYSKETKDELIADPWHHPTYDAMVESQASWDI